MRKCMSAAFLKAITVIYSRHIKENTDHKLNAMLGSKTQIRRQVHDALFGAEGLTSCKDMITFDAVADRLRRNELSAAPPAFVDYFERKLVHSLRENVSAGRSGWTNNNCESYNHILKQSIQWRPQQLPDLIQKLRQLVTAQYLEADRAMCGLGDLMLVPAHSKHRVTVVDWQKMSMDQQRKASETCFRLLQISSSVSSDGIIVVPTTPGHGKKPHQVKRARAARSTTITTKKRRVTCNADCK